MSQRVENGDDAGCVVGMRQFTSNTRTSSSKCMADSILQRMNQLGNSKRIDLGPAGGAKRWIWNPRGSSKSIDLEPAWEFQTADLEPTSEFQTGYLEPLGSSKRVKVPNEKKSIFDDPLHDFGQEP